MLQISKNTIDILKNFAGINRSIVFSKGDDSGTNIRTVSPAKNIFGQVTVPEVFPIEFAVYDLAQFIRVQEDKDLFQEPILTEFTEKSLKIKNKDGEGAESNFWFTDVRNVSTPKKDIKFPEADATFDIDINMFNRMIKAANIFQRPHIGFASDGKTIQVVTFDAKNENSSDFYQEVGVGTGKQFQAFMKVESLKILPGSYTVDISSKKIVRFTSKDIPSLIYYLSLESDSSFE